METDQLKLLTNAMQAYAWRSKALSSNIANLDTPDYRRMSVKFEESLQEATHRIDGAERMSEITPKMQVEDTPPILEDELMELADTQMRTQLASRALREHFDLLRTGITGNAG
ncbi:MAG: flagellar basal body protein [Rhodothermales bacterium]